jgi:hypothetical protein
VAMAWLARENAAPADTAWSTSALAIAPTDALVPLLQDEASAGISAANSRTGPELSLATLDHLFAQLSVEGRADAELHVGRWDLIGSMFDAPTEARLRSADWLA